MHGHPIDPLTTGLSLLAIALIVYWGLAKGGFPGRLK